jgi:hypothetical protein
VIHWQGSQPQHSTARLLATAATPPQPLASPPPNGKHIGGNGLLSSYGTAHTHTHQSPGTTVSDPQVWASQEWRLSRHTQASHMADKVSCVHFKLPHPLQVARQHHCCCCTRCAAEASTQVLNCAPNHAPVGVACGCAFWAPRPLQRSMQAHHPKHSTDDSGQWDSKGTASLVVEAWRVQERAKQKTRS